MAEQQQSIRANIIVRGHVQGVFYRASTLEQAQALRLKGWVQNLPDGGVEILVEGPSDAVENLIAWAKHGPSMARVDDINVRYQSARNEFDTFRVEH